MRTSTMTGSYADDLAYIHDKGYGGFARSVAPGLLDLLRKSGFSAGRVVDLGCGSGIWARELTDAGYQVIGVDQSPDMIGLARQRVPEAELHVGSYLRFRLPACYAVTALGEVFNYLFDGHYSLGPLRRVWQDVFDALSLNGIFVFDVAEPGRCKGLKQGFREGEDWTCLVEYQHDTAKQRLTRRIVSFRKIRDTYRRHEETHKQQLYTGGRVAQVLRDIGFRVRLVRSFGKFRLPKKVVGVLARKSVSPARARPSPSRAGRVEY